MKKKEKSLRVALYLLSILVMVYTSENFDSKKDFAANFMAELLTQNYTKKSQRLKESLHPGLILVNFLKTSLFEIRFPRFCQIFGTLEYQMNT